MAVDDSITIPQDDEDAPVAELVFSCCICQSTVSDVYATVESNQGFHSGSSGEDGIVTKMYIGNCSHVICAKHLDNGTVPFHSEDQHPQVPCPMCKIEHNDNRPKEMFAVQGLNPGQYDPTIPAMWTHCPPIKLDDSIDGMDAMRFQYMALCHYSRKVRKHWKTASQNQSTSEIALSKERKIRRRLQSEQVEQQKKIEGLQRADAQLKKWEDRKPVINHYMNAFSEITKDNERMRGQLIELGVEVPVRRYMFNSEEASQSSQKQSERVPGVPQIASSATMNAGNREVSHNDSSSSARKRKHDEAVNNAVGRNDRQPSRDLMPPPFPRPLQRGVPGESPSHQPDISRSHALQKAGACENRLQPAQPRPESRNGLHRDANLSFAYASSQPKESLSRRNPFGSQRVSTVAGQPEVPQIDTLPFGYAPEPRPQAIDRDPVSLAQLSLQSAGFEEQQNNHSTQEQQPSDYAYDRVSSSAFYPRSHSQQNLVSRHEYNKHDSLPARPSYPSYQSPHATASFRRQDNPAIQTPHEHFQNHSRYGNSPFFDHRSNPRPDSMQRPPARGNQSQQQFPKFIDNYRVPTASTLGLQRFDEVPGSDRGYSSQTYRPQYQSPQKYQRPITNRQQHTTIPQTPRNSQGLFRRPDRPLPPPVFRSPPKPEPRHRSGRITLPPSSTGNIPLSMDQDSEILQIRGVRGMSSYRSSPAYRPSNPIYANSRPLFSAIGRQSIRR